MAFGVAILIAWGIWLAHKNYSVVCDNFGLVILPIILLGFGLFFIVAQQKSRSNPLVSEAMAAFSHELKTPLTSISLNVHYLLNYDNFMSQQTRERITLIGRENRRLTYVLESLLSFTLVEQGRYHFYFEHSDVNKIVCASLDLLADKYAQNDIVIEVELFDNAIWVAADNEMLKLAIFNILDNARQYTPDLKSITVRSYASDGNAIISIIDQGIGLKQSDTYRVFEKYYRVDNSLQSQTRGCGIGLTFSASIVNRHGGEILVHSSLGHGSVFTISLPLAGIQE